MKIGLFSSITSFNYILALEMSLLSREAKDNFAMVRMDLQQNGVTDINNRVRKEIIQAAP